MKKVINKFKEIPMINLWFLILLIPFFRIITNPQYDNDFWFTINQGRYILNNGFPNKAINVIHNFDFIYQSWGSGCLFYLIYKYIGQYGIIFLLIMISMLTSYFFYKLCYKISNNKRLSLIVTLISTTIYNMLYLSTRPHIFTSLNIIITLYLLESYLKTNKKSYLFFLPLISLFEINMHGIYFIILLVICIPYLINSFKFKIGPFKSKGYHKKELFVTYILMILTGFINPYGYKTIFYGFLSYSSNSLLNNVIAELSSPNFHENTGKIVILLIIIIVLIYFNNKNKIPIRYHLLMMGTSFLALDSLKSFNLFIICSFFPLAFILKNKLIIEEKKYSKFYNIFHFLITIFSIIMIIIYIPDMEISKQVKSIYNYLDNEVKDKKNTKIYINLFDGSYAEWRGYYCYIDPRAEIFLKNNNHKDEILKEYSDLQYSKLNYKDFLDKYNFDYLIINSNEDILYYLLKYDSYNYKKELEIYDDDNTIYIIYKRTK